MILSFNDPINPLDSLLLPLKHLAQTYKRNEQQTR